LARILALGLTVTVRMAIAWSGRNLEFYAFKEKFFLWFQNSHAYCLNMTHSSLPNTVRRALAFRARKVRATSNVSSALSLPSAPVVIAVA
jgi:hypothetical protein